MRLVFYFFSIGFVAASFVFGDVVLAASAMPRAANTPRGTQLNGPWQIVSTLKCSDIGETISQTAYRPKGWIPAVVPGTVLTSYVRNGLYPDPEIDLNNKVAKGLIPDAGDPNSVFASPFWYRTTVRLDKPVPGNVVWLNFDGVGYRADVYVNAKLVGKSAGMFKRAVFDITSAIVRGVNVVAVKVYPLDTPGKVTGTGCGGDRQIGKSAAAIYAAVGWDFTFPDGVRDRNIGIFRRVYLTTTGPVAIRDPFVSTDKATDAAANLRLRAFAVNATSSPQSGTLRFRVQGGALVTVPLTLQANETREVTLSAGSHPGLVVSHPRLWWPLRMGSPNLYNGDVSFVLDNGQVSDTVRTDFGIRTIVRDTSFHAQNTFWVNGRRVFITGGSWVQDAMLRSTHAEYETQLSQMAQAGINMLRLWSGSGQESDDFFDVCDQKGIMVWVESGACAQVSGPDDHQLQLDNWADTVLRVRNHPSVAYYCGCNEGWPVSGTMDTTAKCDDTRQYQDSSQQNGQRGDPYRYQGVDCLYDYTDTDAYGAGPLGPFGGFCNETGNPALPPADVLAAFIPPAKLYPTTANPAFDEAINYHDGNGFHLVRNFINQGCALYGSFDAPDLGNRTGLDNYGFKGQLLGASVYRAFSEVWKRNKWDEANKRYDTGYMLWTVNNPNPMVASRLANYTGEPNAALFYFAHGNKPLHAQYDYFYNDISVVNDTYAPVSGLKVTAEARNLDWSRQWSASKKVDVAPDTSLNTVISVPSKSTPAFGDVHFVVVTLADSTGRQLDQAIYWRSKLDAKYGADGPFDALSTMPMAQLKVTSTVAGGPDLKIATVVLKNPSKSLAFFVRLKIDRAKSQVLLQPVQYSDDYFSVLPNEEKQVTLTYDPADLHGESPTLIVEGWNLRSAKMPINGATVTSLVAIPQPSAPQRPMSLGKTATASSVTDGHEARFVTDGDTATRWASAFTDNEWIQVDLGGVHQISDVKLDWEVAAAKDYQIQTSTDGQTWATVKTVAGNAATGWLDYPNLNASGRYVRVNCTARATEWGYSLYEVQVFGRSRDDARP